MRWVLAGLLALVAASGAVRAQTTVSGPVSFDGTFGVSNAGVVSVKTLPGMVQGGALVGANFNTAADQAIAIASPTSTYRLSFIIICNPSTSLTNAVGGIYLGAGKTGLVVLSAATAYSPLTTNAANTAGSCQSFAITASNVMYSATTMYLSLTTPQGSAATADLRFYIQPLY